MKIGSITTKLCKSDTFKKGLELASNNGSLFIAGSQLALATVVRPVSILTTPKTDKDNKKLACAKSIASAMTNYLMVLGVSLPIAKNIKRIDANPEKYLKPKTIKNLQDGTKPLLESKGYQFATQMFKLGGNAVTAIPRAIVTCALIPPIMALVKKGKNKPAEQNDMQAKMKTFSQQEKSVFPSNNKLSFKGNLAKTMGEIIDSPFMQKTTEKFKDSNFQMHTMAVTDTLTTLTLCHQVKNSNKIEDDRKRTLNNNALISTSLGILSGYVSDKLLDKPVDKFITKFSEINKADPKLSKYIEGIKIAKPAVIYGGIYYAVIPMVSTFFAERVKPKNDK